MRENIKTTVPLVEISTVKVEQDLPKFEKVVEFVRQVKDPFHYRCGKFDITAIYLPDGDTFEECLQGMMV